MIIKPGSGHTQADPMSRLAIHEKPDTNDNREITVLKPEQFRIAAAYALAKSSPLKQRIKECSEQETEVAQALELLKKKGPR